MQEQIKFGEIVVINVTRNCYNYLNWNFTQCKETALNVINHVHNNYPDQRFIEVLGKANSTIAEMNWEISMQNWLIVVMLIIIGILIFFLLKKRRLTNEKIYNSGIDSNSVVDRNSGIGK